MEKQKKRFDELEGLRGIAAVVVAVYHFLLVFYVVAFLGAQSGNVQNMKLEDNLYGNPLMVFLSGPFAVAIFFVLSGFVLSIGFFQAKSIETVKKLATKRYLRLMLPALASILLAFIIITIGISRIHEVATISHADWLVNVWLFSPDIFEAMRSGIYDIFIKSGSAYNSVLWTMMFEFTGSFLVFGFLALFGNLKRRWVLYGLLGFVTFNSWFFAFVIGMAMADLFANGFIKARARKFTFVAPILVIGLFLGGFPYAGTQGTIYELLNFSNSIDWHILYLTIGATVLIAGILATKQVAKIMSNKYLVKLGKYTFSLYLVHLLVLYTFGAGTFLLLRNSLGVGFNTSVILTIVLSAPVVAGATYLFERYVDAPSIRFSSYVANILLGYSEPPKVMKKLKLAYRRTVRQFAVRIRKQPELIPDELDAE